MATPFVTSLLSFARELQHAATFRELALVIRTEVKAQVGYDSVWLFVSDTEDAEEWRLIASAGTKREVVWGVLPVLRIKGDAMLEEMVRSDAPIVVEDARADPRTDKNMVARLGSRTIIMTPPRLLDKPLGALGVGTYGDEGCRPPTREQLDYLVAMASQISVAAGRIRFLEERAKAEQEKKDLERKVFEVQKLESLGLLAGSVAHDFNSLLTVIVNSAAAVHKKIADSHARTDVEVVMSAAERGRELTRQLLAMSRSRALNLRAVDLNERLEQLLSLLKRLLPENVEIDLIKRPRLPPLFVDTSQLDQVFTNICIHARDAMPHGGRLTLETRQVFIDGTYTATQPWATAGHYVLATVTDTSQGMTADAIERAFEPSYADRDGPRTGFGLAVAYGIVRQHGGMIHCESELGVGTSFKVYLPVAARLPLEAGDEANVPPPVGNERILVAEDDPSVRSLVERLLRAAGYYVVAVGSGETACHMAATRGPFDVVILDVVMPETAGRDVLEKLRGVIPRARFILSSARADEIDAEDADISLLAKPYDPDTLMRTVRAVLDGTESH